MDALFVIVAELLVVPLILWALIVLELTVGVVASIVSVFLGRRTATDAVVYAWRSVRRRLLWSAIFLTSGLLLADLVFFDAIVTLALGSADDREDLDVSFASAEGSFMLGRIELHQLRLAGQRGGADPSARFDVTVDSVVIDVDTAALLSARFAVEELAVEGVAGSVDRLRAGDREARADEPSFELAREFSVERLHVGELELVGRDHTGATVRELELALTELDLGPLHSESAVFDLLHRARGRGSIAGVAFVLTAAEHEGVAQTTLEIERLPLDAIAEPLERASGLRARGEASLTVVNRYREAEAETEAEPALELAVDLQLRALELEPDEGASVGAKLMFEVAARALAQLGEDFPLSFEFSILRSELASARSLAESGIFERVADKIAGALRDKLREQPE